MAPAAAAVQRVAVGYHDLPTHELYPSNDNPRRHKSSVDDQELTDSVRQVGILEPLIVRPKPSAKGRYQVVAGHRRLGAAQTAGLLVVPAIVRELTDAQALEIAVIENDQRKDVHPLDEAESFARLLKIGAYTPVSLAQKLGRPRRYIVDRLRLEALIPEAKEAFEKDEITISHAIPLARLSATEQKAALKSCIDERFEFDDTTHKQVPVSRMPAAVADLKDWIDHHVRLDLTSADTQEEFPELVSDVAKVEAAGARAVMLSDEHSLPYGKKASPTDPLYRSKWEECKKTDKAAQYGVIVEGRRRGRQVYFRLKAEPKRESSSAKTATRERAAEEKREAQAAREDDVVIAAITAAVDKHQTLEGKSVLAFIVRELSSGDSFSAHQTKQLTAALKVPAEVFGYIPKPALLGKLSERQLVSLAIARLFISCGSDTVQEACTAFGIDFKAIDKIVEKQHAMKAAAAAAAAPAKAKKVKKR